MKRDKIMRRLRAADGAGFDGRFFWRRLGDVGR